MYGSKIKIVLVFTFGLFILLISTKSSLFNSTRISAVDIARPLLKVLDSASGFVRGIVPFASYRREIGRLHNRIDTLTQEVIRLEAFEAENRRLRAFLHFRSNLPFTTIPAQVIGRDPSNWSNSIIIDKGSQHEIRTNMAVISSGGLVGKVVETGKRWSKIMLITDPDSRVGAILEKSRQGGVVVGRPGGTCKMIYISLDTPALAGEKVFTAGYGTVFPKGLLIGEVVGSGKEPGRLYKYAILKTSQNLSRVEEVLCIR